MWQRTGWFDAAKRAALIAFAVLRGADGQPEIFPRKSGLAILT